MTVSWNILPGDSWAQLTQQRVDAIERDIVALVDSLTDQAAAYMHANARWTDRTGAARAGLWSDIQYAVHESIYLLMSHDVTLDYVYWLEYAHAGRFEILSTTSDHFWPILYNGVVAILRRHSG